MGFSVLMRVCLFVPSLLGAIDGLGLMTAQAMGFALAVMQLALGIEFILSGIELQALVIQRMMAL